MKGYLYVADESGEEIEGSRRSLARCETRADYIALRRDLEAKAGAGCLVKDSEIDRDLGLD